MHEEMVLGSDHRILLLSLCGCMVPELDMETVREYHGSVSRWRRLVHCVRQWVVSNIPRVALESNVMVSIDSILQFCG